MKYNFLTKRLRIIVYELATEILRVFQLPVKLKLKFVAEEHFFEENYENYYGRLPLADPRIRYFAKFMEIILSSCYTIRITLKSSYIW